MKKLLFAILMSLSSISFCQNYDIGAWYFPGWKNGVTYAPSPTPWAPIQQLAPDRQPRFGYYDEGNVAVTERQIDQIVAGGLSWIGVDWYWDNGQEYLGHWLASYKQAKNKDDIKITLMWANHNTAPTSLADYDNLVNRFVDYMLLPQYKKIDNIPFITVFDVQLLDTNAKKFNYTVKQLFDRADSIGKSRGLDGVKFVCSAVNNIQFYRDAGCSGKSIYNMHLASYTQPFSHTYPELDNGYRMVWNSVLNGNPDMPYILPMTAGWNKKPWGGTTSDPLHDNSVSTPETFETHLKAAKAMIDSHPSGTLGMGVVCCWNEFGEGSYIEPTRKDGTNYLDKLRKTFNIKKVHTIGNSWTRREPMSGWDGNWGMASTDAAHDYSHLLRDKIRVAKSGQKWVLQSDNLYGIETSPATYNMPAFDSNTAKQSDVVVFSVGDNYVVQVDNSAFAAAYLRTAQSIKPASGVLACLGTWWSNATKDALIKTQCEAAGGVFVDMRGVQTVYANVAGNTRTIANVGVGMHPSDAGMEEIARRIFVAISPLIP